MGLLRSLGGVGLCALALAVACEDETKSTSSSSNAAVTSTSSAGGASSSTASTGTGGCGETTNLQLTCGVPVTNAMVEQCDVLKQDCGPGMWCDIVGGKTTCVADAGGVKCKGDSCAADGECQAGLKCINDKCSPFCCQASDEPCGAGLCLLEVDFGNTIVAQMCSYPPQCQLLADNCPEDGLNCYPLKLPEAFAGCFPQAVPAIAEGAQCLYINDCGESSICHDDPNIPNDIPTCRQLCDLTDWMTLMVPTGGCPMGRVCNSVNWGNTEWMNIGICLPDTGAGGAGGN